MKAFLFLKIFLLPGRFRLAKLDQVDYEILFFGQNFRVAILTLTDFNLVLKIRYILLFVAKYNLTSFK
jgi:hypothetical protein